MAGPVVISPNLKKTSHRILPDGKIMDVPSKQIVGDVREEEEYRPPATVEQPPVQVVDPTPATIKPQDKTLAEQIKDTEAHLAYLMTLKKAEIVKKKKELEELEKL